MCLMSTELHVQTDFAYFFVSQDQASGVLKRKPYLIPAGVILAISSLTIVGSMVRVVHVETVHARQRFRFMQLSLLISLMRASFYR